MPKKANYYEILGLKETSSNKEIRDAFINLTKQFHPDRHPNNPGNHEKIILINEAYSTLSKPELKQSYDFALKNRQYYSSQSQNPSRSPSYGYYYYNPRSYPGHQQYYGHSPPRSKGEYSYWRDETFWEMRDRASDRFHQDKPYYGIRGVNRLPNSYIVGFTLIFMGIGMVFHYQAFKYSRSYYMDRLNEKDERLTKELITRRKAAEETGVQNQIKRFAEQHPPKD